MQLRVATYSQGCIAIILYSTLMIHYHSIQLEYRNRMVPQHNRIMHLQDLYNRCLQEHFTSEKRCHANIVVVVRRYVGSTTQHDGCRMILAA